MVCVYREREREGETDICHTKRGLLAICMSNRHTHIYIYIYSYMCKVDGTLHSESHISRFVEVEVEVVPDSLDALRVGTERCGVWHRVDWLGECFLRVEGVWMYLGGYAYVCRVDICMYVCMGEEGRGGVEKGLGVVCMIM